MVTFSFALRKVRTAELMPKEKTMWTGQEKEDTEKNNKTPNSRCKWSGCDHARCGTVELRFTDSSLIRKVFLVPSPYILSKFNPLIRIPS